MLLLAIDTAGANCAVALARSEGGAPEILARKVERIGRGHAEILMPMIEDALGSAAVSYGDLDRIAVATGPGSFTGVRVGVATARGLALALDIPAVGVGTLKALASPVMQAEARGTVVAVLDAKRGEVYGFAQDAASGAVLVEATVLRGEALAERLEAAARPLILVGAGASILAGFFTPKPRVAGLAEAPDITEIAVLGFAARPVAPAVPTYARGADAKPQADKAVARR
jgi:tRNA threonylcarbamoyladenosine biosynthesis protein TsaB